MASVVISHDLAVVKYLADRIGVMYLGKLVELGTGDDIYRRAGAPVHRGADQDDPACPIPRPSARRRDVGHPRRAAEPDRPAVRLPLQDALPACAGAVRSRRSRRCAGSGRRNRRPATSRFVSPSQAPPSATRRRRRREDEIAKGGAPGGCEGEAAHSRRGQRGMDRESPVAPRR